MVCYIVPTTAAIVHFFMRKKIPSMKSNKYHVWLNQLFLGGAVFGIVDHLWNGELFLFGKNILWDLALGVTITLTIIIAWGIIVLFDKLSSKNIVRLVSSVKNK
jgi:hypothetical protein